MDWIEFAAALGLFLISHRIPALIGVKAPLTAALGPRGHTVAFSLISTALLAWVISTAGLAPYVGLWDHEVWHRWTVNIVVPVTLALIVFGTAAANPFAFEGRSTGFDPARRGIAGLTRQPLLWGLALWSEGICWQKAIWRMARCLAALRRFRCWAWGWLNAAAPTSWGPLNGNA